MQNRENSFKTTKLFIKLVLEGEVRKCTSTTDSVVTNYLKKLKVKCWMYPVYLPASNLDFLGGSMRQILCCFDFLQPILKSVPC